MVRSRFLIHAQVEVDTDHTLGMRKGPQRDVRDSSLLSFPINQPLFTIFGVTEGRSALVRKSIDSGRRGLTLPQQILYKRRDCAEGLLSLQP